MRTLPLLLTVLLLIGVLFQISANAQITYIIVYGQLTQFQCPVGAISGPCTGISLITNGTTAGIPNEPMLDFSQSVVPGPAQTDFGKIVAVTGYYGQESPCSPAPVNGCPAFFVHIWGPYYGPSTLSTATSSWSSSNLPTIPLVGSSNPQTFLSASPNVYFLIVFVILLGCLFIYRKKKNSSKITRVI